MLILMKYFQHFTELYDYNIKFQYDPVTNNDNNYCIYSSWVIVEEEQGRSDISWVPIVLGTAGCFATWFHFISCLWSCEVGTVSVLHME